MHFGRNKLVCVVFEFCFEAKSARVARYLKMHITLYAFGSFSGTFLVAQVEQVLDTCMCVCVCVCVLFSDVMCLISSIINIMYSGIFRMALME